MSCCKDRPDLLEALSGLLFVFFPWFQSSKLAASNNLGVKQLSNVLSMLDPLRCSERARNQDILAKFSSLFFRFFILRVMISAPRSLATIHCNVMHDYACMGSVASMVTHNRGQANANQSVSLSMCMYPQFAILSLFILSPGVSMQYASTRKKPNAFNLLHQLRLLRSGQAEYEEVHSSCWFPFDRSIGTFSFSTFRVSSHYISIFWNIYIGYFAPNGFLF